MQAILLQGDHPTLPAAELEALLEVHGGGVADRPTSRTVLLEAGAAAAARAAQAWAWGDLWGIDDDSPAGIERLAAAVAAATDGQGTAAVRSIRYGDPKSPHAMLCERTLGTALAQTGHGIDLRHPELEVFAWLGEGRIVAGRRRGARDVGFEDRIGARRAHFSPVGMHPRRAAGLVHMARVPPGGRILDPFCGTGGIVLEAALLGFDTWASDIDAWMVQGTLTTLTDAAPEPLDATVFRADIGDAPDLVDGVQGIVTDLPYGTASSTHDEDIQQLYDRALEAFARILAPGGHAVVGHARPELLAEAPEHSLEVRERHAEFVHRSLTRQFVVLRRA